MEFTVENVCGFLIRSRLLAPEEVRSMYQRWLNEAKDQPGNLAQFSKWLVQSKYVTEYQAALLIKGHADQFFLNQYQILDRLGRGRMAGVYKAVHHLGQVVAIKVLPPSKAKNAQMLGRFEREARLAMRLRHPNVVRAFQLGEANDLHYLVMEFLEGETLDEVLQRRRRLPANEAVHIIHQALLGLQHIHEQGMVHRDLKPANLMLVPAPDRGTADNTSTATVKILDIGLGREMLDDSEPAASANPELTKEGVLLGTPDYLAPEQARDPRNIDIRADIYSLGCVLYHALSGQAPFPDSNLLAQMVRHATETPKPLKEFNPAIPDGLQQIVNWMLAKKPEERYPTPERAAQALQVFLVADSDSVSLPAEGPQMRKFLTWLETDNGAESAPAASPASPAIPAAFAVPAAEAPTLSPTAVPAASPAPVVAKPALAVPTPQAPAMPKANPAPPTRSSKKHKPRPSAGPAAVRTPRGSPAATPAQTASATAPAREFDVELVPLSEAPTAAGPRSKFALTGRDWVLLGIGAGSVIVAGIFGMILAMVLRGSP